MSDEYVPEGGHAAPVHENTEEQSRKRGRDETHDDDGERQYKKQQGELLGGGEIVRGRDGEVVNGKSMITDSILRH
jgi:hypothetical protein